MFVIHANRARNRFAVYSSWRKSYSLSQWMNVQKYGRSVFSRSEFQCWLSTFESLFRYKKWNTSCGVSLDHLFKCEIPLISSVEDEVTKKKEEDEVTKKKEEEDSKIEEEEEEYYAKDKTPGESWDNIMCETAKRIAERKSTSKLPLIKKDVLSRRRKQGHDGDLIWELSFAHSKFDVKDLDRNYRDIVKTARRAHKEAIGYVSSMGHESLDEVSDMQQDALDQEHPFGIRCSYSEMVHALYSTPVVVSTKV